jgi:hypothetical protein
MVHLYVLVSDRTDFMLPQRCGFILERQHKHIRGNEFFWDAHRHANSLHELDNRTEGFERQQTVKKVWRLLEGSRSSVIEAQQHMDFVELLFEHALRHACDPSIFWRKIVDGK